MLNTETKCFIIDEGLFFSMLLNLCFAGEVAELHLEVDGQCHQDRVGEQSGLLWPVQQHSKPLHFRN